MFKCDECGHIFEYGEEISWREDYGETFSGCPMCKGTYQEVYACRLCGDYNCEDFNDTCEKCKEDIAKRFETMIREFTEEEREILREIDAGEMI